jgi:hypothetical protein
MTARTNARLAGFMFLFYIANGIVDMIVSGRATAGRDTAARLATIAQHTSLMQLAIVLTLLTAVDAFVLGVALYGLTRDVDRDLAVLALLFRACEGVLNTLGAANQVTLMRLATRPQSDSVTAVADSLFGARGNSSAILFALGSTIFAYLFLRGRSIPPLLAWLGIIASVLLVIALPLQLTGVVASAGWWVWMPMLAFELILAFWLLIKGVKTQS